MEGKNHISIIIPSFNRQELIRDTLDSVLAQTYDNWECIVVDDGSTDETWKVLEDYVKRDARLKIHKRHREPKGAPTCRNIGMELSEGEYLMFLDSDDVLAKECLSHRLEMIKIYPNRDAWIFDTSIFQNEIGDDSRMWNKLETNDSDLIRFLKSDPPWSISGPLWRNKDLRFFDEKAIGGQDWEFHIRYLLKGVDYIKIEGLPKSSFVYCRRNSNRNTVSTGQKNKSELLLISDLNSDVIKDVFLQTKDEKVHQEAVYFLLRSSVRERKSNHIKNALEIWKVSKQSFVTKNIEYYFWKVYIFLSIPYFIEILEYFVYRVIKKGHIFNRSKTLLK